MSDYGVKETQCTRCGHREVCSLKTEFLEAQKAIDEVYVSRPCEDGKKVGMIRIRDIKYIEPVELRCKHYIPMWRKETIKNKIYALVLIGIGVLSIFPENDATACMFFCIIGVPLFFAKENWIMDGGGSDYVYEKSRRESVRSASDCRRKESDGYRNPQTARRVRSQTR